MNPVILTVLTATVLSVGFAQVSTTGRATAIDLVGDTIPLPILSYQLDLEGCLQHVFTSAGEITEDEEVDWNCYLLPGDQSQKEKYTFAITQGFYTHSYALIGELSNKNRLTQTWVDEFDFSYYSVLYGFNYPAGLIVIVYHEFMNDNP